MQEFQQSGTNRHVNHDTVSQGYPLRGASFTITACSLLIPNLYGNINEPYGRVVCHANDDTIKANQDDYRLDSTNCPQAAASGSGGDDEEDPNKKNPNNNGCGGDKIPSGENNNNEDDDEDREPENGFTGEAVDVLGSDNPNDFSNIVLDDDMDIDENDMVEVGVVDEIGEEDLMGLWEE